MADTVTVAGVDVTQDELERIFADLRSRHWFGIPKWYKPSLGKFRPMPSDASTVTLEEVVYDYMTSDSMPRWFKEAHMGASPHKVRRHAEPEKIMGDAGFPPILWAVRRPWDEPTPEFVKDWAARLGEPTAPWMWITCADGYRRAQALAHVAVAADGGATYVRASDLCEKVGSAPLYGENNKSSRLQPYKEARLLLIDGLGNERHGAPELDTLWRLMKARHEQMLPTVMASESDPSGWARGHRGSGAQLTEAMTNFVMGGLKGYGTRLAPEYVVSI